jgi:hypothetical protein
VASFAQASAAEAEAEVEHGMFEAAVNRTNGSAREAVIRQRAAELEQRVERLRRERAELTNRSELSIAERARAARVTTSSDNLRNNINETAQVAMEAGVNTTRLERLRSEARELSGPEVAEIARGLSGLGPETAPGRSGDRGPPGEGGPGANRSDDRRGGPNEQGNPAATNESDDRGGGPSANESDGRPGGTDGRNETNPGNAPSTAPGGGDGANPDRGGSDRNDRTGDGDSNGGGGAAEPAR